MDGEQIVHPCTMVLTSDHSLMTDEDSSLRETTAELSSYVLHEFMEVANPRSESIAVSPNLSDTALDVGRKSYHATHKHRSTLSQMLNHHEDDQYSILKEPDTHSSEGVALLPTTDAIETNTNKYQRPDTSYDTHVRYSAGRARLYADHCQRNGARHKCLSLKRSLENFSPILFFKDCFFLLPSVLIGTLLNILDGLSYGMLLFPLSTPLFADLGPSGLSIFYVSCIISQLVFSCGASGFGSSVTSEMIEVVPFFHTMAFTIMKYVAPENRDSILATLVFAMAISSILTGAMFLTLGYARLGFLMAFFPRHILAGCIGGIGWFLFITGIEVTARLGDELSFSRGVLAALFLDPAILLRWTSPLILCMLLWYFTTKFLRSPLIVPGFILTVCFAFHLTLYLVPSFSLEKAQQSGWVIKPPSSNEPWWSFYTMFKIRAVDWMALLKTVPAMMALVFFSLLHVPINIPALASSLDMDNPDFDRELVAHGISNILSGLVGSVQNYLVYTNSVLFARSGADSRLAGILLAIATTGVMLLGPCIIGKIPVMTVGVLIYLLGLDLLKESLVDTAGKVSVFEYLTIWCIVVTMSIFDFVGGILIGIIMACVSFVVQSSRSSIITGHFTGLAARSTVRRNAAQQKFLFQVGDQIHVIKLAGQIFLDLLSVWRNLFENYL